MEGFAGKVAVVTGAGSGIGQALALELGRSGASVAISDVDTEGLAVTEERLKAIGAQVKSDRLNVTEREAFLLYADGVKDHFGKVNQIYNNAGIAYVGDVEVTPFKDIERVMDVDFWGVVNGTKAFLPHLIDSGDGHVVNVSSLFGIFSVPGLQLSEVRRPRLHRSASAGDAGRPPPGEGHDRPSGRHQDGDHAELDRCRRGGHQDADRILRQEADDDHPREGGHDHLGRGAQEQGAGARRGRREGARPHRPNHRIGLPEALLDGHVEADAARPLSTYPPRPRRKL
jgi:hypothetical protein